MGVYFGKLRVGVELPRYDVVTKSPRGYEIRKYHAAVAAEVHVENGNQMKGSEGFRALAKYIGAFGTPDNKKKEAIKMTAPVVTQPLKDDATEAAGEKIAMTAPVVTGARNEDSGGSGYWMQFIMPSKWTMETLPEPTNPSVRLTEIPERYLVALYFSGRTNDEMVKRMEAKLLEDIKADGLEVKEGSKPVLARYNDPFTPGFLRTNEIWIQINPPPAPQA